MSCGKRPLVKLWEKPKNLKVITPSRYEQNEASVKIHWKTVIKNLEDSYKDDQFWETQMDTVRELVGPVVFRRIAKIYNLPLEATKYAPKEETSIVPSEQFYVKTEMGSEVRGDFSMSDVQISEEEEEDVEEESAVWSISSVISDESSDEKQKTSKMKGASSKSINVSKTLSKLLSKSFSRCISRTLSKTTSDHRVKSEQFTSPDSSADSADDLDVHFSVGVRYQYIKPKSNPHFEMLYCNESETDMIKWESHYKQKAFEVSASDEFSKRAEILTKKIAKEFYEWWTSLGNVEFKSEIKRPEDIEALFQVWFDEHASRGLMLHPKTLPCVLNSIAEYTMTKKASCANALKRQLAFDIHAETSPSHTMAFGTSLPQKKKHIPPRNNTKKIWDCVRIPEDLKTMSCVWEDIQHLTSTKSFHEWLQNHPNLPMPPCFKALEDVGDQKQQFVIPSDFILSSSKSGGAVQELALPVSQFTLELKQVLSKLMNE